MEESIAVRRAEQSNDVGSLSIRSRMIKMIFRRWRRSRALVVETRRTWSELWKTESHSQTKTLFEGERGSQDAETRLSVINGGAALTQKLKNTLS